MGSACKRCVTPFPAVMALEDAWVHRGSTDRGYVLAKIKGSINEGFSLGTILGVPYVDPDNSHVGVFGGPDDAWPG